MTQRDEFEAPPDVEELVDTPIGGGIRRFQREANEHQSNFVLMRGPGGVHKVSLPHEVVFKALWQVWMAKRVTGDKMPGASVREVVERSGLEEKRVRHVLNRLTHHGVVISTRSHTGYQGATASYRPTEQGLMLFAIAETLGPGHMISIGGTPSSWKNRSDSAPSNIFEHAQLQGARRQRRD